MLDGGRALPESDVYSFGLVLFELLTWQLPWGGASPFKVRRRRHVNAAQLGARLRPAPMPVRASTLHCRLLCLQIIRTIAAGGRPEVPPLEALPGPDKPSAASYATYCQLMR